MIAEILILLTSVFLFAVIFMAIFLTLAHVLVNFAAGQIRKMLECKSAFTVTAISFGKVFFVSFVFFSFFMYSMSFLLRMEKNIFQEQKHDIALETRILTGGKKPPSQREELSPPLFDFVIQSATEQNAKKQLNFILASGGIFALATIVGMGGYLAYMLKNKTRHEI